MSAPALLAVAAVAVAIGVPVLAAGAAAEASSRAAGAADAAALAAADAVSGWVDAEPCDLAEQVASAASVQLVSCLADPASGESRVVVSVQTVLGAVFARAHASPAQSSAAR